MHVHGPFTAGRSRVEGDAEIRFADGGGASGGDGAAGSVDGDVSVAVLVDDRVRDRLRGVPDDGTDDPSSHYAEKDDDAYDDEDDLEGSAGLGWRGRCGVRCGRLARSREAGVWTPGSEDRA